MQPGSESHVSAETPQFAKYLHKDLLGQVFRLRYVAGHTPTQSKHAAMMELEDFFETQIILIVMYAPAHLFENTP